MQHKNLRILIAGGVFDARRLAYFLSSCDVAEKIYYSLSGITGKNASKTAGIIFSGGFGGATGLAEFIRNNQIDIVIDALHPYAQKMANNIAIAAKITGCRHFVLCRNALNTRAKNCRSFANISDITRYLPFGGRVFLTLGQSGNFFVKNRKDIFFLLRKIVKKHSKKNSLEHSLEHRSPSCHYVYAGKSFLAQKEYDLMKAYKITHLVTRQGYTNKSLAKFKAAQKLGVKIFLLQKPFLTKNLMHNENRKIFYNHAQIVNYICSTDFSA